MSINQMKQTIRKQPCYLVLVDVTGMVIRRQMDQCLFDAVMGKRFTKPCLTCWIHSDEHGGSLDPALDENGLFDSFYSTLHTKSCVDSSAEVVQLNLQVSDYSFGLEISFEGQEKQFLNECVLLQETVPSPMNLFRTHFWKSIAVAGVFIL